MEYSLYKVKATWKCKMRKFKKTLIKDSSHESLVNEVHHIVFNETNLFLFENFLLVEQGGENKLKNLKELFAFVSNVNLNVSLVNNMEDFTEHIKDKILIS